MQKAYTMLALVLSAATLSAQLPYTAKQYGWRIEKDLEYGTAPNYAGIPTTLILDLYKPVGDDNTQRPLLVLVHGGAWVGGCKDDASGLAVIAQEMAQRGYVVASVNYRLGWHKSGTPIPNPFTDAQAGATLYPADSSEIIRAMYRGQQDVKGVIRWLKARTSIDSTCSERVLVGGESAGGFLALAVGFLDREAEKPVSCFALPDAPNPAANVTNSYTLNCTLQIINPGGTALQRPDLGPIDGTLNLNGHDANVRGVLNLFGGVLYEAGANNWLQGPDTPAVYLYHQTCDGIVPFAAGYPFFVISNYCNLGFTPWHTKYPQTFGSGSLAAVFGATSAPFITDFDQCPAFNPALALFECIRYSDNGSYHYTNNPAPRSQKIADYFSLFVTEGSCHTLGSQESGTPLQAQVSPNPFSGRLSVFLENAPEGTSFISLSDVSGKTVWTASRALNAGENVLFEQNQLPAGFYALQIRSKAGVGVWKLVRE
ncbi:MAG: T9SS type A sorting domain-containing protein [Saprospiraceae bacterium]